MRGMSATLGSTLPLLDYLYLRPYASFVLLVCEPGQEDNGLKQLRRFLERKALRQDATRAVTLVASGFLDADELKRSRTGDEALDYLDGLIYRVSREPSWALPGSGYADVSHTLAIVTRRRNLVALHCPPTFRDSLQKWLNKEPRPPMRRLNQAVINAAFLAGEAKGLWLKGTHASQSTRPDGKNLTGKRLQDALDLGDSSFALASGRATIPNNPKRVSLKGMMGSTPRAALVWNKSTTNLADFLHTTHELFTLIEEIIDKGTEVENPFPLLAVASNDLTQVRGAYDLSVPGPGELYVAGDSEEIMEAADALQGAYIKIGEVPNSPNFSLTVGRDGCIAGRLQGFVKMDGENVRFAFGFDPKSDPTNLPVARELLDALGRWGNTILTIYYRSGHTVQGYGVYKAEQRSFPFRNWQFADFSGFEVTREKPSAKNNYQEIHDLIGSSDDRSLFSWVCQNRTGGWLTCDDGPEEIADFIYIDNSNGLEFIHVKGAISNSLHRSVAVGAYSEVISQAVKNLIYRDLKVLRARLLSPRIERPATWEFGARVNDRSSFIETLDCLEVNDKVSVTIVQPHLSEETYKKLREAGAGTSDDWLRLMRLEMLLNGNRATTVALGSELTVIGEAAPDGK